MKPIANVEVNSSGSILDAKKALEQQSKFNNMITFLIKKNILKTKILESYLYPDRQMFRLEASNFYDNILFIIFWSRFK